MKELNMTETQLLSWRPRRPASGLKEKIFTAPTNPTTAQAAAWFWGALAPAAACALLTLMGFNHGNAGLEGKPMMALALSNQSYTAYDSENTQTAQNHLATVTFDSTNRNGFRSIIAFTPTTNFSN